MTAPSPLATPPPVHWQPTGSYEDILFERSDEAPAVASPPMPADTPKWSPFPYDW